MFFDVDSEMLEIIDGTGDAPVNLRPEELVITRARRLLLSLTHHNAARGTKIGRKVFCAVDKQFLKFKLIFSLFSCSF